MFILFRNRNVPVPVKVCTPVSYVKALRTALLNTKPSIHINILGLSRFKAQKPETLRFHALKFRSSALSSAKVLHFHLLKRENFLKFKIFQKFFHNYDTLHLELPVIYGALPSAL